MDNKVDYKKLWAGVGLSRGSFDPNGLGTEGNSDEVANFVDIPTSAPTSLIAPGLNSSPSISDETQGSSLNIGVNVGAQIAKRWVIQAGISYLEQNTSSSSNAIAIDNSNRSSDPLTEFNDLSRGK